MVKTAKKTLAKYKSIPVAAKATLWFAFSSIIQRGISTITTPIFTRLLTPEQYGQFSVYNSWLQIFTIFVTLRLNYAVFNKGMSKYTDDRNSYTSTMQSITTFLTFLLFTVYILFHNFINQLTELSTFITLAMFAELLFSPAISFWSCKNRYNFKYKRIVFVTLLITISNAVIGVIAVLISENKGTARIISCVLVQVIIGAFIYYSNIKNSKKLFVKEFAKFAIIFNLPLIPHYFSVYILEQFDRIMIQKMVSLSAAGIYSVAYNIGLLMKIVTTSINNSLVPWIYKKLKDNKIQDIRKLIHSIIIFAGAIAILFIAFAPELISIFAGEEYQQAIYIIPPVALSVLYTFIYTIFANIEFYYDANKFTMVLSISGAALNIALNYIGITMFGFIAAAYTTLICFLIFTFTHYYYLKRVLKQHEIIDHCINKYFLIITSIVFIGISMLFTLIYQYILIRYIIVAIVALLIVNYRKRIKSLFINLRREG